MDFSYSDVQTEFRSSLRRFFTERTDQVTKADPREMARRWRARLWTELADLGTLAALLPEAYEGMGGDAIDAIAILEEAGRAQAGPPVIENAIIAAGLIERLGSTQQKQALLPAIAAGSLKFAFAEGDVLAPGGAGADFRLTGFEAGTYRVEGRQPIVVEAPECDYLLLLCGGAEPGRTLFCLKRERAGVVLRPFWTLDDRPAASLILDGVELDAADRLGPIGGAGEAVAAVLDLASIAQCAEAAGLMASLLNLTIAHLKTRTQFGQPLANFQALQHRLADMVAAYELSLSLTFKAAILSRHPGPESQSAASGAKVQAVEAARLIGHEAIQMHGAMGMSLELPVGRAVKRLKAMEPQYGSAAYHLGRYRALRRARAAWRIH
jgi:alkylation response protein AidB-like acyl-CoA dehydrogenase